MSYYYRQVQFGPGGLSPAIRNLIIVNAAVFLLQSVATVFLRQGAWLEIHFGLTPAYMLGKLHVWQPFTYMFLHGGLTHILFNMLYLWMFGTEVEHKMGARRFTIFYLFCGVFAGLCVFVLNMALAMFGYADPLIPTIGASGACFGIMLAFGLFFPDRIILLFFIIPVRALYLVFGLIGINLYYMIFSMGGGVSYVAHVGGAAAGFIFLKYYGEVAGAIEDYSEKSQALKEKAAHEQKVQDQLRVDEILDKINTKGMHTLTKAERKFLQDRSKRRKG